MLVLYIHFCSNLYSQYSTQRKENCLLQKFLVSRELKQLPILNETVSSVDQSHSQTSLPELELADDFALMNESFLECLIEQPYANSKIAIV